MLMVTPLFVALIVCVIVGAHKVYGAWLNNKLATSVRIRLLATCIHPDTRLRLSIYFLINLAYPCNLVKPHQSHAQLTCVWIIYSIHTPSLSISCLSLSTSSTWRFACWDTMQHAYADNGIIFYSTTQVCWGPDSKQVFKSCHSVLPKKNTVIR